MNMNIFNFGIAMVKTLKGILIGLALLAGVLIYAFVDLVKNGD